MSTDNENMERTCVAGLGTIFHWFSNNSPFLNCSKAPYIRLHTMQNKQNLDINLEMGDDVICRAISTKFLGLLIDENLNWKEQCAAICSRLGNLCFLIRNIRTFLSDKQVMYVYNA